MAYEIASNISSKDQIIYGSCLTVVAIVSVVMSCLTIVTFARINKIFKAYRLPVVPILINMTITDLLYVIVFTVPAIISVFYNETWLFGDVFCKIQGVLRYVIVAMNTHCLALLVTERLVYLVRPTLHQVAFTPTCIAILLFGLWVFDATIACLPLFNWALYFLTPHIFQCSVDWVLSTSYQSFHFVLVFALPFVYCTIVSIVILVYVDNLIFKQRNRPGMTLYQPKQPYLIRLARIQLSLAFSPRRKRNIVIDATTKKARYQRVVKDPNKDGYGSDQSEDEEIVEMKDIVKGPREIYIRAASGRKSVFKFRRSDFVTSVTYELAILFYFLFWLMYISINYYNSHNRVANIPTTVWLVAVFLVHASVLIKPVIFFLHNYKFNYAMYYALRPWYYRKTRIELTNEKLSGSCRNVYYNN